MRLAMNRDWIELAVFLTVGIWALVQSWRVWRNPDRLRNRRPGKLSRGEIERFAKVSLVASVLLIVLGLIIFALKAAN